VWQVAALHVPGMSFHDQACAAGVSSLKAIVTVDVRCCASVPVGFGNLYDGTFGPVAMNETCPAKRIFVLSQCLYHFVIRPMAVRQSSIGWHQPEEAN
jgi:hypothetical protein